MEIKLILNSGANVSILGIDEECEDNILDAFENRGVYFLYQPDKVTAVDFKNVVLLDLIKDKK